MDRRAVANLVNLLRSFAEKKIQLSGKIIHARIFRTGLFTNTYLSNRLIDMYVECSNHSYARNVFGKIPVKDSYSWNSMLSFHCKTGHLRDAYELFVEMPERNAVTWNNMISGFVRGGLEEQALDFYGRMISEAIIPTRFTLASVLCACSVLLNVGYGRRCHGTAVKIGLDRNIFVGNASLCMYIRCGVFEDAVKFFNEMAEHNEVSFTTMIDGLVRDNQLVKAFQMFKLMCEKRNLIDSVCLSNILGVCAKKGILYDGWGGKSGNMCGRQIHCLASKLGFVKDLHLNNSLLDMYSKDGDMDSTEMIFADMSELNSVSWNIMIDGFGQKCQSDKSVEYLKRMRISGFDPSEVTYINMLGACVKSRDLEACSRIFNAIPNPSVSSWNAILSGYFHFEKNKEVVQLFKEMQLCNEKPDRSTLAIILNSCAELGFLKGGKQVHAVALKASFHSDKYVASALIGVYSGCGKIGIAKLIFDSIAELDTVCWNSMIAGLSANCLENEAFMFFKRMRRDDNFPNEFSYGTTLGCCAKLSCLFPGQQIHGQIVKDGYTNDVFVGTALINMYSKCGDVEAAGKFFSMMPIKTLVTWNEMIHGYAQSGCGTEAVGLYQKLISMGENPDAITFVSVLAACSHSGLTDLGIEIFNSMEKIYGIVPKLDHWISFVDCLCRADRFEEAEVVLKETPYKNEPVIWEVVLSSCRIHGNTKLAKRAAETLSELDPRNSNAYVLLANTYSSVGQWDEAKAVRGQMKEYDVVKDPGLSWVECNVNAWRYREPHATKGGLKIAV